MAFATKYTTSFDVLESPARILATYTVAFLTDGFSGTATEIISGGASIQAKISNSQDSFIGVHEKKLNIELLTDSFLSELQVSTPKQWKVIVTKTIDEETITDFIGWLIPTSNQTDYVDDLKYVRLEATDGLNYLKNIDFVDDDSIYYEGLTSVFDVIKFCLQKTGMAININTINNTFGSTHNTGDADEALKQRYVDMDLFRGENEPIDTYKVLGDLMLSEKCRVFQEDGEWWIENVSEKRTGTVKARKYDSAGTLLSSGSLNLSVSAVHNSNYQPMAGGSLSNLMPIKWAKIEHKLAKFKNQLLNRDFRNYFVTDFIDWTRSDNSLTVTRTGDGTSGNPYGAKLVGFATKNKNAKYLYQNLVLGTGSAAIEAIKKNIVFSGQAFTQDVSRAIVAIKLTINVDAFVSEGINYPASTSIFGLNDSGEWIRGGDEIALDNEDINKRSKKTPVQWDITSKKISDVGIAIGKSAIVKNAWNDYVNSVTIQVQLKQGVIQLNPYDGEIQDSNVWYKNVNLGWVNADTNLNLKQLNYKATNPNYAPNDETYNVIYGDYTDAMNLSTLKNADGSLTSLWTSKSTSVAKNFHTIGVNDILSELASTQKVYDGTIWGLLKYRHSVALAGFTNRGYVVGYTYSYADGMTDVRIIEHKSTSGITTKKTGVLSDGTEIDLVGDSTPSTGSGNGTTGGGLFDIKTWVKQILGGVVGQNQDEDTINFRWDNLEGETTFDFGSMVRTAEGKVQLAKYDDNIEIGSKDKGSLVNILNGHLGLAGSYFYDNSIYKEDGTYAYSLGLDTHELMIEGDLEMAGKVSVGQGYPIIEKRRDEGTGEMKAYIDAAYSSLELVSSNVNVNGTLGVGMIDSVDGEPIVVDSPIQFNYNIILNGSVGVDHQFFKYNGTSSEWAFINLGEIQKTVGDENYLIKTGNSTLEKSIIYETSGRIGIGNLATIPAYKVDITGNLHVSSKLYINGDFGADHKFLKSNGTGQEFAYINLGEIQKTSGDENYLIKTGATTLTKSRLFDNGTFFGLGTSTAIIGYDIIAKGPTYVDGNLNVHGKLYINESFGADHAFLKSNGTTQEWAVINTGELSDKLDLVMLVTDEGERGFKMYSDANKTVLEGFVFTNSDTGIFGLHGYRLNGSATEQYGLQIDKDTFLYHVLPSGVRYRILTTNDNVTTGGGGSGTYTASSPLFITQENHNIYIQKATSLDNGYLSASDWSIFNGKQDLLSNASSSVTGKLTSTDWTTFNNKLNDGDTILDGFDFSSSSNSSSDRSSIKFTRSDDSSWFGEIFITKGYIPNGLNITCSDNCEAINIIPGYIEIGAGFGASSPLNLYGTIVSILASNFELNADHYYIYKGATKIEIDMSGFASGKFLKATSSTKAEWV